MNPSLPAFSHRQNLERQSKQKRAQAPLPCLQWRAALQSWRAGRHARVVPSVANEVVGNGAAGLWFAAQNNERMDVCVLCTISHHTLLAHSRLRATLPVVRHRIPNTRILIAMYKP
jgi:hypothetical protein